MFFGRAGDREKNGKFSVFSRRETIDQERLDRAHRRSWQVNKEVAKVEGRRLVVCYSTGMESLLGLFSLSRPASPSSGTGSPSSPPSPPTASTRRTRTNASKVKRRRSRSFGEKEGLNLSCLSPPRRLREPFSRPVLLSRREICPFLPAQAAPAAAGGGGRHGRVAGKATEGAQVNAVNPFGRKNHRVISAVNFRCRLLFNGERPEEDTRSPSTPGRRDTRSRSPLNSSGDVGRKSKGWESENRTEEAKDKGDHLYFFFF